ncbi:hypothetical protein BLS_009804 [Venturia inaequalis]|uniref:Ribosome biogenesis protein NOP53 n=1 Tax=Venturia inaequalis TaxID=5025 RepID=A0A8H3YLV2_VENIN|nr:hypothetical protein BLS_009804 [Venturia inaequalis]KAE9964931.1 hypothetical protein EG328_010080 [Venturia inaequalis]RDI80602.1 hypothetical protein Vi05172_g9465 [Venturia inaequalis]
MSATILPPRQSSQPSRKGKKAWRKNVDLTEVESGVELVREEIIKGGIIAEKTSEQLFTTDVAGSTTIQKSYNRSHKPLKADEILAQRSAIPAVSMRKRPSDSRTTDGLVDVKRRKKDGVSGKEYEKLRKIAYGGDSTLKEVVQTDGNASYDPWAVQEVPLQPEFSFLDKETKKFKKVEPRTLKHAPISMAKNGKAIPAVPRPDAGKSYNPTLEDWQAVLEREGSKAVTMEQKRLAEERRDAENQARIEKAMAEEERANESAWESEWESEWEGILSEGEPSEDVLKKKRPERKTKTERNKILRRKEEERKQVWEKKQKQREAQVTQAKALLKSVREKELAIARKQAGDSDADDSTDTEQPELRRRKIGPSRAKIPEAPLEVVLADELQDSLRRLKPEGNLLTDRFRTMILRGKVETRAKNWQWKKPGKKVTEKWSYKDWKLHK